MGDYGEKGAHEKQQFQEKSVLLALFLILSIISATTVIQFSLKFFNGSRLLIQYNFSACSNVSNN